MKKLLYILLFLPSLLFGQAQPWTLKPLTKWTEFKGITTKPTHFLITVRDSNSVSDKGKLRLYVDEIGLPSISQSRNDGNVTGLVPWLGSDGLLKFSPKDSLNISGGSGGTSIEDDSVLTTKTWSSDKIYYRDLANVAAVVACTTAQNLSVQSIQGIATPNNALFTAQASSADNGFYSWTGSVWAKVPESAYFNTGKTLFTVQSGDLVDFAFIADPSISNYTFRRIGGGGGGGGSGTVNTGVANRLAYYASSGTTVDDLPAITASRALASDANGLPVASTTTATELGYVNGVTSAIQTQIDSKQATLVSGTNIKTVNGSTLLGSGNLAVGDALVANPLSQFASTTSAQLAGVLSDETGSGSAVFSASPTFTGTPILSTPTATNYNYTGTAGNGYYGGSTQSTAPTVSAFGTDAYKTYLDNVGRLTTIRRYGVSAFTLNEDDHKNIIGNLINDNYDRANASLGYTTAGSNATYVIPGTNDRLTVTNGTGNTNYTDYALVGYQTWLRCWEASITFTASVAGNGIAIGGIDEDAGNAVVARFNGSTGAVTFVLTSSGVGTTKSTSAANLTFSSSDLIKLSFIKDGYKITARAYNVTTGTSVQTEYNASLALGSTDAFNRRSRIAIFSMGGTQNIYNLNLFSKEKTNNEVVLCGDSRFWGLNSGCDYTNVLSAIMANYVSGGATVYCASGGRMEQFVNQVAEACKTVREGGYVYIDLGVNDAAAATSQATFQTYVNSIITQIVALKRVPIFSTVVQTTAGSALITSYNTSTILPLNSTRGMYVVNSASGLSALSNIPSEYTSDGTHYSIAGNLNYANYWISQTTFIPKVAWSRDIVNNYVGVSNSVSSPTLLISNTGTGQGNGTSTFNRAGFNMAAGNSTVVGSIFSNYNTGGDGNCFLIRTSTAHSIKFYTAATTTNSMELNSSGQLVVGTGTGIAPLTVIKNYSGVASNTAEPFTTIRNDNTGTGSGTTLVRAGLNIQVGSVVSGGIVGQNQSDGLLASMAVRVNTNHPLIFVTNNVEAAKFDNTQRFGIGVTTPLAVLHLKAGTAAAGTAPLKFTSGTNLTTPEAGAVEFDGSNFFGTVSTTRYQFNKTLPGSATLNFPSTVGGGSSDLTITVTGAVAGSPCIVGADPASVPAGGTFTCWVSATNTVSVRYANNDGITGYDPASGTFKVSVIIP